MHVIDIQRFHWSFDRFPMPAIIDRNTENIYFIIKDVLALDEIEL
jgi:hypothetical protein